MNYPRPGHGYTVGVPIKKKFAMPRWVGLSVVLVIAALLFSIPSSSQLQQSGGGGSNLQSLAGTTISVNNGTTDAGTQRVTLSSDGTGQVKLATGANTIGAISNTAFALNAGAATIGAISNTAFGITGAIPAGTNVIGIVNTIPKTACGNTVASQALVAVPTVSTAVFASTTCLQVVVINNTNSSAATITVSDNAGTPINDVLTFSIPANSQLIQPLWGVAFSSGVKWTASTTGLTGALLGYQ
jgi:hypothetical protein